MRRECEFIVWRDRHCNTLQYADPCGKPAVDYLWQPDGTREWYCAEHLDLLKAGTKGQDALCNDGADLLQTREEFVSDVNDIAGKQIEPTQGG